MTRLMPAHNDNHNSTCTLLNTSPQFFLKSAQIVNLLDKSKLIRLKIRTNSENFCKVDVPVV